MSKNFPIWRSMLFLPAQVAIMNEEFAPAPQEIEHARGVIAAYEQAAKERRGAVEYKSKMVDQPVVARAQELLRRTRSTG